MDSNMSEYEKKISELRSRLKKVKSSNSRKSRDIDAISTEIERLENEVYTNTTSDSFDQELEQVEALIAKNQMIYKENSNKLLEIHNEMLDISASENLGNFSVEDFAKNDDERKKKYEKLSGLYDSYGRVKRDTLERKKALAALVRKRNKLKKDMELSDSLHIGASQYREITDTLRKRKIVISILEQDPYLASIIKKPYKEQTPDERKAIKAAKEEIIKKISEEIQRGASISESIEILYSLDAEMILKKKPREVKMNLEELKNIVNSSDGAVVRFVGYQEKKEPLKAPDDMLLSSQGEIIDKAMNSVYTYSKNYHVLKGKDDTKGYTGEESKEFLDSIRGTLPGVNEQEIRALANRYAMAYHDYRDMVSNARNYTGEDIGAANDKVESARIEIENYIKNYYQEAKANQGKDDKNGQKDFSDMTKEELEKEIEKLEDQIAMGRTQGIDVTDLEEQLKLATSEFDKKDINPDLSNPNPDFDFSEMDIDDLRNSRGNIHNQLMLGQAQGKDISDLADQLNAIDNEIARREKEEQNVTQPTVAPTTASQTTAPNTASHTTAPNTASHTTAPNTASHTTAPKKTTKPTVYSVQSILAKLTNGLDVGKKDVKRFNASNIKVRNTFKEELHSGNVLYNVVHVVPTIFKTTVGFFRKLGAKIMLNDSAKKNVEILKSRINILSDNELQFLFDNYRGNAIVQDMNLQINDLLQAKLKEFGLAKVEKLNDDIKKNYSELFTLVGQINALDNKTDKASITKKQELYAKASVYVKNILNSRKDANSLLSGGVHGQEEDFKAAATKMNYVGLRFSKIDDFDSELQQRLGETELRMNQAIAADEPKATVDKFLELEALYSKNTEVKKSIVGRRSVGAKCYSPLAEELNYKDDPFIKDLFTTIAVTSATVSAFRALSAQKMINQHNQQLSQANSNNQATIDYVHQTGNDIASRRGTFAEGMKAQGYGDTLGTANLGERYSLDGSNWHLGSDTYRSLDSHFHQISSDNFANVSSQLNDVVSKYGQGTITNAQALQEIAKISSSSNNAFMNLVTQSKEVLSNYTASHPQFDLSAVQGSIDYLVNHTDAIANMNQSMVDVTNLGGGLADVTLQQLEPLTAMPGLYSSLIAAASSAALASGVSKSMRKKDREKYAEELSQMIMEGYGQELEENEKGHYM